MINKGDTVRIVRTYSADEACYIGLVGEVVGMMDFPSDGSAVYDVMIDGESMEFYSEEVELVQPPKDYDEDAEYAAKDADVSTWVKEEEIDEYNEIVIGLSQAIAMKAAQMRGEEPVRNLGDIVSLGCETPAQDIEEAEIFSELRGHRESEMNGILQDGITPEQARAAMKRAKLKVAEKAYEEAKRKLEDLREVEADGDIPTLSTATQILYGSIPGHPHGITMVAESPNPMGNVMDNHWMNDEPVGKEVIYDVYNTDPVQAPEHYVNSKIEPIDYMADKLPAYNDGHTAFCVGNVIKYVSRAPHKGNMLQDLRKAAKYLEFAIEHEEKKQG